MLLFVHKNCTTTYFSTVALKLANMFIIDVCFFIIPLLYHRLTMNEVVYFTRLPLGDYVLSLTHMKNLARSRSSCSLSGSLPILLLSLWGRLKLCFSFGR